MGRVKRVGVAAPASPRCFETSVRPLSRTSRHPGGDSPAPCRVAESQSRLPSTRSTPMATDEAWKCSRSVAAQPSRTAAGDGEPSRPSRRQSSSSRRAAGASEPTGTASSSTRAMRSPSFSIWAMSFTPSGVGRSPSPRLTTPTSSSFQTRGTDARTCPPPLSPARRERMTSSERSSRATRPETSSPSGTRSGCSVAPSGPWAATVTSSRLYDSKSISWTERTSAAPATRAANVRWRLGRSSICSMRCRARRTSCSPPGTVAGVTAASGTGAAASPRKRARKSAVDRALRPRSAASAPRSAAAGQSSGWTMTDPGGSSAAARDPWTGNPRISAREVPGASPSGSRTARTAKSFLPTSSVSRGISFSPGWYREMTSIAAKHPHESIRDVLEPCVHDSIGCQVKYLNVKMYRKDK